MDFKETRIFQREGEQPEVSQKAGRIMFPILGLKLPAVWERKERNLSSEGEETEKTEN